MKTNEATSVLGRGLELVPYQRHHVARYHQWMQSEELLELTASEPLSLEAEYDMQQKWHDDDDKCTFILLERGPASPMDASPALKVSAEVETMVGDVNLFFNVHDEPKTAELEVMIAKAESRRKGYGREAVLLMMYYGTTVLGVNLFVAKIGMANGASISLFESLGFKEVSRCEHFEEVTLQLPMANSMPGLEARWRELDPHLNFHN